MRTVNNSPLNITREVFQQDPGTGKLSVVQVEKKLDYFTLMIDMLKSPPEGGWKTGVNMQKQLSARLDLIDRLDKAISDKEESVIVEESEFEELLTAYKSWAFAVTSREILAFDNYILNIPKTDPKK